MQKAKKVVAIVMTTLFLTLHLCFAAPAPALAINLPDFEIPHQLEHVDFPDFEIPHQLQQLLKNRQLIESAQAMMETTPETFCNAYFSASEGVDDPVWSAIQASAESVFTLSDAIISASVAGAGPLSGYAGIASVVSHMGLGGVTTAIAGSLGSNVAGAAATSVVTSAIGGPVVMGAILAGGAGLTAYGTYKLGQFTVENFDGWANNYCSH